MNISSFGNDEECSLFKEGVDIFNFVPSFHLWERKLNEIQQREMMRKRTFNGERETKMYAKNDIKNDTSEEI